MDLPLIAVTAAEDGTELEELDMGVVLYSCSFAVIFLMILSQVLTARWARLLWRVSKGLAEGSSNISHQLHCDLSFCVANLAKYPAIE